MTFVNLTPHSITLNNGAVFDPSGQVARVTNKFTAFDDNNLCYVTYGHIVDLPDPKENTMYVVSSIVLTAAKQFGRQDVCAPATGHPDCKRNERGQILSVPGFVR